MYQLTRFDPRGMTECGAALRRLAIAATRLEEVALEIVRFLYTRLIDEARGVIRAFKTHPSQLIGPALQHFAAKKLEGELLSSSTKCFLLLASAGQEPEWNDRLQSKRFRAIPLGRNFVLSSPCSRSC